MRLCTKSFVVARRGFAARCEAGLCPAVSGPQARTRGTAPNLFFATGGAKPRLTSGGKAEGCSAQGTSSLDVEDGISHQTAKPQRSDKKNFLCKAFSRRPLVRLVFSNDHPGKLAEFVMVQSCKRKVGRNHLRAFLSLTMFYEASERFDE